MNFRVRLLYLSLEDDLNLIDLLLMATTVVMMLMLMVMK